MSLYERAQTLSPIVVSAAPEDDATLANLKVDVQRFVSIDDIAALLTNYPHRAKSELLGACRQVFQMPKWVQVPEYKREELRVALLNEVLGFGPIEPLLEDSEVTEIMVNGPCNVYFEKDGKLVRSKTTFTDQAQLRALIDRVLGPLGRRVDEQSPMVNARLPKGHRVNVVMPPLAPDGPAITIRKFTQRVISLDDMCDSNSLDEHMLQFLTWAVQARKNVVVSGGTGSGKTTLLNALSCCIPHEERIVTIEDTAELRFLEHPHVVRLEARPKNAEGAGEVTIRDLVVNALRMRPDRIVVGECRGAEAADMLTAMNTGHDGSLTTLHANSPSDVMGRLVTMVRYGVDLPVDVIEANAASAFDVIVQTSRALDGSRFVSEVAEYKFCEKTRACEVHTLFSRKNHECAGIWHTAPEWVRTLGDTSSVDEQEVCEWLSDLFGPI